MGLRPTIFVCFLFHLKALKNNNDDFVNTVLNNEGKNSICAESIVSGFRAQCETGTEKNPWINTS